MRLTFWGVRGSVPWATAGSIGHGCNTPCIEVRDEASGAVLVLDAGSGIVGLGAGLGAEPRTVPIVLSHFHWDHLQGLPFFRPFHTREWTPTIWAPRLPHVDAGWVATIFDSPFYPVPVEHLPSKPAVRLVDPGDATIDRFRVRVQPLTHPGGAFAYRIRGSSGDVVYATDHEFGDPAVDAQFAEFARGAAAIVMDAHFTPDELAAHKGWGHASWRECAEFARANGVGSLWLFHHRPGRNDLDVTAIRDRAREIFARTDAAREGATFTV